MTLSGTLDAVARYEAALAGGFNSADALTMAALSYHECGNCDMSSVNSGGAIGLFQIQDTNFVGNGHVTQWGDLSDPVANAKAAFAIFSARGGDSPGPQGGKSGFYAWCVYPVGCNQTGQPNQFTWDSLSSTMSTIVTAITTGGGTVSPSDPITPPASGGSSGGSGAASGSGGGSSSGSPTDAIGNFFQDVLTGIANALKGQVPVANVGNFPVSGTVVVGGGIFFLLLGAILWKGSTVVKVAAPGSVPAKALAVAAS